MRSAPTRSDATCLSRLIYGARVSLMVALLSVLVSTVLGTVLGMIAGFFPRQRRDHHHAAGRHRAVDPGDLLGDPHHRGARPGLQNVVIVLGFTRWPRYARVAYGQTLAVMGQTFMRASAFNGASALRLLGRHVLPNIAGAIIVVATLEFGLMVLFEAGLSFLGSGCSRRCRAGARSSASAATTWAAPGGSRPSPGSACFSSCCRST
jgi:peptide/nickel transport system permease protein